MTGVSYYANGILTDQWDDVASTYTQWDDLGNLIRGPLTYSSLVTTDPAYPVAQEAPARLSAATAAANLATLQARAQNALANNEAYLSLSPPTSAQALAQVAALTRQVDALIRITISELNTVSDS